MQPIFEQAADISTAVKAGVQEAVRFLLTSLPGILSSDTPNDGHNAEANSAVMALVRQDDGTTKQQPMPPFQTMPIHFHGGGRVVATHPTLPGDEGIILFAARALDSWRQSGGQQIPIDARQHHPSDAWWIGGVKSDPNRIKNVAAQSHQARSLDGRVTHEVHPDNGTTTRVVDPSDGSSNPFSSATIFHQTIHSAISGIVHTATDASNTHTITLQKTLGMVVSVVQGSLSHLLKLTPLAGYLLNVTKPGKTHTISVHPDDGISIASSVAVALSAPPGMLGISGGLSVTGGGAVTGGLNVDTLTAGASTFSPSITIDGAAGTARAIWGTTSGVTRWRLNMGNAAAESGGNVGSDLTVLNHDDSGTVIDTPLTITRSTGAVTTGARFVAGTGYGCRPGTAGALRANSFNIDWTGAVPQLWIDTTNLGTFSFASDYRMKEDIVPLLSTWEQVKDLNPVRYRHKDWTPPWWSPSDSRPLIIADGVERWGFIAHELQEALIRSAATGSKDEENVIQSPNPWTVLASLTKALQEAMERIEALENR